MYEWYSMLAKPAFAPSAGVFGPVWTFLYVIIALTFGYVFYQIIRKRIPAVVGVPFFFNLVLNVLYTPVAFGLRSLEQASLVVLGVFVTIIWMMVRVWPYSRPVAYAQIPYLLWVSFASVLQFSIMSLN